MTHELFHNDDFWQKILDDVHHHGYETMGQRLIVDTYDGRLVTLKNIRGEPAGTAPYLGWDALYAGDSVWVEPVARKVSGSQSRFLSWVVVGKIYSAADPVRKARGTSLVLVGGMDIGGSAVADGSSFSWLINGATGAATLGDITATSSNVFMSYEASQTSSNNGATTDITNFSEAISTSVALPVGTWTVRCLTLIDMRHSASNRVSIRAEIDGNAGSTNSPSCPATDPQYRTCKASHSVSGISGNRSITIRGQYKSLDVGTTTPNHPLIFGTARRTA